MGKLRKIKVRYVGSIEYNIDGQNTYLSRDEGGLIIAK